MKFLFDLDDTLVKGDIIQLVSTKMFVEKKLDKIYTNADVSSYDLSGLPLVLSSKVKSEFANPEHVWAKSPIPGANYFLSYLERCNHQIGIVTARPVTTKKETEKFLKARFNGINFDLGIWFANHKNEIDMVNMPNKTTVFYKINPTYYFDDNVEYCEAAQAMGIKTFLLSNKHTPWNHTKAQEKEFSKRINIIPNVAFFPEILL